ncbi:tryptophan 7-halogenase [Yinghuangia sp. ASG 101]|uniref:FAD-dependent oxidoreductase n=1 Tax=Yinghuangia sp. ASG 101 TaxID=2896848 RepID=UPI001E4258F3|nr:tryptophan 7-halogenase [Yinghuangia sp. ASG 101]UGQ11086.1 tryptophan 7-halogenase [Yinghuangia sp. ASG 101]
MTTGEKPLERVLVIGGSIAGTLAAAAVAPHFTEVVLLDRDELPEEPVFRKGVPQGAHFHALLAAGRQAMDELLPGFSEHAFAMGAARLDSAQDVMRLDRVGWSPRFPSTLEFLMASRPLIEKALRDKAKELPGVRYESGVEVTGLTAHDGRVTGVRTKDGRAFRADLVIDASGRFSRGVEWLHELGYPAPTEEIVNAHWGYSSTFLRVPENWSPGFRALAVTPFGDGALSAASASRAMAMWVVEGDRRWILTVQGSAGDHPPRTEAALRAFISSIGVPELDKALADVEFPEPISMWRDTRSRLRDFAGRPNRPEGFLTVGDAWMGFNPVYGQGMTAAALEARDLRDEAAAHLAATAGDLTGLPERFYTKADALIKYCWHSSNALDHRVPGVEYTVDGEARQVDPSSSDFTDRLAAYTAQDRERYIRYRETTQLLRDPAWLSSDEVVSAVRANWDELGRAIVPR